MSRMNVPCRECGWEPIPRVRRKRFSSNTIASKVLSQLYDVISKQPWFVSLGCNSDTIIVEVTDERKAWADNLLTELFQGYTVLTGTATSTKHDYQNKTWHDS